MTLRFLHRLLAATLFVGTATASAEDTKPLTRDDLSAGLALDQGEFGGTMQTGRYSVETVNAFLDQFVGTWEGKYTISTMDATTLMAFDTQLVYEWEQVGDTRVLRNQSVYTDGNTMATATSLSYFWRGRIVSEVTEKEIKRVYLGVLSEDGKTVKWNPANTTAFTRTTIKETFGSEDGKETLKISGYEDYQKGMRQKMLILTGELTTTD